MTTTTFPSRVRTEIPGPRSREIQRMRTQEVSASVGAAVPVYIASAEGSVLTDVDGNEFIDFGSGIGVLTLGHVNSAAVGAAIEQARKFTHALFTITPYEPYVEVCRLLNTMTPGSFEKRSLLFSTGAEAIENAVKIARAATGRNGVAVVDHAYHGRTNMTLAMNYQYAPYATGAGPRPGEIYRTNNSYPYRDGLTGPEAARRAIERLEVTAGAENLACLVVEPIQGEGGIILPAEGFLPVLQEWCNRHGIVVIADEIQVGLGRTGALFASELFGFEPDLVATAKALAAGFPVSAVTGRASIMDAMVTGGLSGTFSGNPVGCAAAIEILGQLQRPEILARAREVGERIQAGLAQLKDEFPVIGEVRGVGGLHGIELSHEDGTPAPEVFDHLFPRLAERGLVALPGGDHHHVLRMLPAITISDDLIDEGLHILREALATL